MRDVHQRQSLTTLCVAFCALFSMTTAWADTVSWIAGSGNYDVAANWDASGVPCQETRPQTDDAVVPDTGVSVNQNVPLCSVSGLSLGDTSTFSLFPGTQFNATTADIAATINGGGNLSVASANFTGPQAWVFGSAGANIELLSAANSAIDTRLTAAAGATLNIGLNAVISTGAPNSDVTIAHADGAGAEVLLGSATELDAGFNSSFGNTQFHQVLASNGGVVDLSGLTLATGPVDDEDFLRFSVTDTAAIHLDSLNTVSAGGYVAFQAGAGGTLNLPSLQSTVDAVFFATDDNSQILANASAWTFSSTGRPNTNTTLANAAGNGALVDLSGMTALDAGFNSVFSNAQFHQVLASSGGTVNLSGVTQVIGPVDDEDFLSFSVSDTATIVLDGLQSVTAGGYVSFSALDGAALSLPALQDTQDAFFFATNPGSQIFANQTSWTFSSTGRPNTNTTLAFAQGAGALIDLSGMSSLDAGFNSNFGNTQFHQILASDGGVVDLSGLTSVTGPVDDEDYLSFSVSDTASITLAGLETISAGGFVFLTTSDAGVLELPALQSAQNAFFSVDTGGQILANGSNWTFSSSGIPNTNANIIRSVGPGALIDLSGMTVLNADFNSNFSNTQWQQIVADTGGAIDLSGVTQIAGPIDTEDYLRVSVSDTASINLDGLQSVSAGGYVLFEARAGATLALPSLQSTLDGLFIADEVDSQIFANASDWSFSSTGLRNISATLVRASAAGAVVDLSGMTSLNAGFNSNFSTVQSHTITAENGGIVDLRGVDTIIGPADGEDRLDLGVGSNGTLILGPLDQVTDSTTVNLTLNAGGIVEFPRSLNADQTISVVATADSSVGVTGSLSFQHVAEEAFDLETARVAVVSADTADIEIGSANEGTVPASNPNFGFAQLIVGSADTPTNARLVDVVDNGNGDVCGLAAINREALYLNGFDAGLDADGLRILNGSTLTLGGFDVYAAIGGVLMHLNPMLTPGVPFPYDEGFIELGTPFDADGDGVPDGQDNCVLDPNPDQIDADADGYGNACDGDLNGDLFVNNIDLAAFAAAFLSTPGDASWNPAADFDNNGVVNFLDFVIITRMFLEPPGPACPIPSPA